MFKTIALVLLVGAGMGHADEAKPAPKVDKKPAAETAQDKNKALVRRFYDEVWNKGHLAVADEVFATDYVRHDPGPPAPAGPEGQKQVAASVRKGLPDLVYTVDFMVAENDLVVARWTIQGTQTGDMMGAKPTGKKVTFSGVNIFRFGHGKVVELWNHRDDLSLMVQLGRVQLPAPPPKH